MRVIAGRFKGRRLFSPRFAGVRPTSDRLKETLFNVIGARVEGAAVLDAFAGSGAVGIEALSRGAADVTFIEHNPRARALIRRNLAHCGVTSGYAIVGVALPDAVRRLERARFDLIFLDPPYESEGLEPALDRLAGLVEPSGLLVLEHARRRPVPESAATLVQVRRVRVGEGAIALYASEASRDRE